MRHWAHFSSYMLDAGQGDAPIKARDESRRRDADANNTRDADVICILGN